MIHLGDFPASHTAVCIPFGSYAAATGAPSATTNFAAGDVLIYKDGGTTQRSSSAGITVSTSFDSITGIQMIVIDLSDNTDAGFYAAGHEFQVIVGPITIDGQTVYFPAATFSIERAGGILSKVKALTYTVANQVDVNVVDWKGATAPAMTGDAYARLGAPAGASVSADIAAIRVDTNTTIPNLIAALNNISSANVKTQVVAALNTDTYGEPAQGTPAATATLVTKIGTSYKFAINKHTQTATEHDVFNNAGDTVDHKSTCSDDGTTFTHGKFLTGP